MELLWQANSAKCSVSPRPRQELAARGTPLRCAAGPGHSSCGRGGAGSCEPAIHATPAAALACKSRSGGKPCATMVSFSICRIIASWPPSTMRIIAVESLQRMGRQHLCRTCAPGTVKWTAKQKGAGMGQEQAGAKLALAASGGHPAAEAQSNTTAAQRASAPSGGTEAACMYVHPQLVELGVVLGQRNAGRHAPLAPGFQVRADGEVGGYSVVVKGVVDEAGRRAVVHRPPRLCAAQRSSEPAHTLRGGCTGCNCSLARWGSRSCPRARVCCSASSLYLAPYVAQWAAAACGQACCSPGPMPTGKCISCSKGWTGVQRRRPGRAEPLL